MTKVHVAQNNFTSGQLDPTMHERYDYEGYQHGAKVLDDFLIIPQGGVQRRPGSRFVKLAKNSTATRVIPFVISNALAFVLEFGERYIRFYQNSARVETSPGVAYEIQTSYLASQLHAIHVATRGHTMVLTHPSHPVAELIHITATSWIFRPVLFAPPPTHEVGITYNLTLTLSAQTGNGVTVTSSGGIFYPSDVDRVITEEPNQGQGRGVITQYNSDTSVLMDITNPFSGGVLYGFTWRLSGSPNTQLHIDKAEPVGARVTLITQMVQPSALELVTDGTFPNLLQWSDFSGRTVLVGTAEAGSGDELLVDTVNFITAGVRPGHRVLKASDSTEDSVVAVNGGNLVTTKNGSTWAAADDYEVRKTGVAYVPFPGKVYLDGGIQGLAHIEQAWTTVPGATYRVTFDVSEAPLSFMVGDSTDLSNALAEFVYQPGNTVEAFFTATSVTSVGAFRNNQNAIAGLTNVSVKLYDANGFRPTDLGRYIRVNSGIIELTEFVTATTMRGVIRKALDDAIAALPGAWALEDSQWSSNLGYPNTLTFQGGRLNFGGSPAFPNRIWGSRISVYSDYGTGVNASDPYQFDLASTEVNTIQWMAGEQSLVVGTDRNEFIIRGELGHTITPTGVDATSPTGYGSTNIQPARTPQALMFIPRSRVRLYESASINDFTTDARQVEDRSITAENLTADGITAVSYQQEPRPVVWIVTDTGQLHALTYLKEHVVAGWAPQTTTGTVLCVCVIPHPDGDRDQLWLLVVRTGSTPSIEYLDDSGGFYGQSMMDAALIESNDAPVASLNGLDHLEELNVAVLGDGMFQGIRMVMQGEVAIDPPAKLVEVGLPFTPRLTTLRPTYQNIPLAGLHLSNIRINVALLNTLGCTVNNELPEFAVESTPVDSPQPLYTGLKEVDSLGWDFDADIVIEQPQPYPITVLNVTRYLEVEDVSRGGSGG